MKAGSNSHKKYTTYINMLNIFRSKRYAKYLSLPQNKKGARYMEGVIFRHSNQLRIVIASNRTAQFDEDYFKCAERVVLVHENDVIIST